MDLKSAFQFILEFGGLQWLVLEHFMKKWGEC